MQPGLQTANAFPPFSSRRSSPCRYQDERELDPTPVLEDRGEIIFHWKTLSLLPVPYRDLLVGHLESPWQLPRLVFYS